LKALLAFLLKRRVDRGHLGHGTRFLDQFGPAVVDIISIAVLIYLACCC
jgi:hypothetical protein